MPVYKAKEKTKDGRQFYYSISYVDIYGAQQRIKSKKYLTKKEAEKAEAKQLLELEKAATETMTFNKLSVFFLEERKNRMKSQSFIRLQNMLKHMLATLGDVQVNKLTVFQFQRALEHLDKVTYGKGKKLSPNYKNKIIRAFKQMIAFGNKRYNLYTNVPGKFEPYRDDHHEEMKFINQDELNKLLSVIDDQNYRALFIVLFYMGFRVGEANALSWEDVDFETNNIKIKKTLTTKAKSGDNQWLITSPKTKSSIRTLPMPQIVSNELLALREYYAFPHFSSQWFVFGGLKPLPESNIQHIKNKAFKDAKIPVIRVHDFRHSCASYLINNGASILLVSKWLGHSNTSMTLNRYSHLYKSELLEIVNVINTRICT